ncbi:ATP phosphoribosyltransferase [Olsenella sp. YH-ols2217]|uniref:ATP phosphoribosyltransferase regulatory subunit n=1 Tax=Kribbibacterium absianum TaxID=3044210 RepID=A0ABT6ZI83_9ACTN|nr:MULTISPECIES: ATP phosphoribosyltransferase [unclassified Olsenella]MDJ1121278.1 ATP phosphoribosyltransferase [Olsenella sp. YH-ols2216]MDJ1128768.1 ATP phosphoribosyltransferase [Olsenella sp. YH-ols2217]
MLPGTPRGFRDVLPQEALAREQIADAVRAVFSAAGYEPVETPLLESREVLERAGAPKGHPFQLIDGDDRLLMLRPDLTLPIARMVAQRFGSLSFPLRLRYQAPVVREQASLRGAERQFTQLGVELIGGDEVSGEAEVMALLGHTLETLGVKGWRIVCGSVRPLAALLEAVDVGQALKLAVLDAVHGSDFVLLDQLVDQAALTPEQDRALRDVPRLHGGPDALDRLESLLANAGVDPVAAGVPELRAICSTAARHLGPGRLAFDFSIINSFDYYTGLVFKAYAPGVPWSVASGGRYDAVLENMELPSLGACGFALSLERLQEAIEAQDGRPGRRLRIAVPKGSLFRPTVELLEKAGLPVDELLNLGRRLIVSEGDVEYLIVRATDAPAFVAFGGADCGICGADSLFEANLDLVQLEDLGYGSCHFVVAEPRANAGMAEENLARRGSVRVATKYPRITQAYYDRIGCGVDILALHGNIELGPIVGMADRIVDITATGTTLRENDLVVVDDDVMECTARFFAGTASFRTDPRVRQLAEKLRALRESGAVDTDPIPGSNQEVQA